LVLKERKGRQEGHRERTKIRDSNHFNLKTHIHTTTTTTTTRERGRERMEGGREVRKRFKNKKGCRKRVGAQG